MVTITKADAEKDNVIVPTTLEDYCLRGRPKKLNDLTHFYGIAEDEEFDFLMDGMENDEYFGLDDEDDVDVNDLEEQDEDNTNNNNNK